MQTIHVVFEDEIQAKISFNLNIGDTIDDNDVDNFNIEIDDDTIQKACEEFRDQLLKLRNHDQDPDNLIEYYSTRVIKKVGKNEQ